VRFHWFAVASTVAFFSAFGVMGAAQQSNGAPIPQANSASRQTIGQFVLNNENGESETVIKGNTIMFNLSGPDLSLTTSRYDITAPRMSLELQNGLVQTGTATGGVKVEVRNPEQGLTTTLTCDAADYVTANKSTPARIYLRRNVRSVTRGPQLAANGPLIANADSGYVEFPDGGSTRIVLKGMTAKGTPNEPAPKKKP